MGIVNLALALEITSQNGTSNHKKYVRVVDLQPVQIVGIKDQDLKRPRGYSKGIHWYLYNAYCG